MFALVVWSLLAAWVVAPASARAPAPAGSPNMLVNPGFEAGSAQSHRPTAWTPDAFTSGARLAWNTGRSHSGRHSVSIQQAQPNDARWTQTVAVQPHTVYELSGWIRTRGVAHSAQAVDAGASLGVIGRWERTPAVLGTTSDWRYVSMTVDSGEDTSLLVAARLGFWSGTTTGTAWFDDVRLAEVTAPQAVARWKILTLIYPRVDVTFVRDGVTRHVVGTMSAEELGTAREQAQAFAATDVPALSSGAMVPVATIRTVDRVLTKLDGPDDNLWPSPEITAVEADAAYDAIIVVWQAIGVDQADGTSVFIAGGNMGMATDHGTGQLYTTVTSDAVVNWPARTIFKHEFGHSIVAYFHALGRTPWIDIHDESGTYVHCGTGAPYVWVVETLADPVPNSTYNNESGFTHDYYSGTAATADDPGHCIGVDRAAWAVGGPLSQR